MIKKIKVALIIVSSSFAIACFIVSLLCVNSLKLSSFDFETKPSAYVCFNELSYIDKSINLKTVLNDGKSNLQQVFCIYGDKAFFTYQYLNDYELHICLASIELDGENKNIIFDEIFSYDSRFNYTPKFDVDYSDRNSYIFNGKIVVTDFEKLVEFDVMSNETTVYKYHSYPMNLSNISWCKEDIQTIVVANKNKKVVLNEEALVKSSLNASELFTNNNNMIWNRRKSLEHFFDSIQIVNGEIYLIGRGLNFWGSTYAIIFTCDIDNQSYSYSGYKYVGDLINQEEFYIVPVL